MGATVIAAGQTFEVRNTYEDVKAALQPRTLAADNGMRELVTTEGEPFTVNVAAVALVTKAAEATGRKCKVGFVKDDGR